MSNDFLSSLFANKINVPNSPLMTEEEMEAQLRKEDPMAFEPAVEELEPTKPGPMASPEQSKKMQSFPKSAAEEQADLDKAVQSGVSNSEEIPEIQLPEEVAQPKNKYQEILEAYRSLKPKQEEYQGSLNNLAMLQGANQIAQGMARGYGADIGSGEAGIKALKDAAQEPLDSVKRQMSSGKEAMAIEDDIQMQDPDSDVSKFYREQAYAVLKRLNPKANYDGKLEGMSASQLQKLPGMKNLGEASRKTDNRYVTIQDPDGTVRSKLIDMTTGETIKDLGLAGYAYGSMIDPRTKEAVRVSKSDPRAPAINPRGSAITEEKPAEQGKKLSAYEVKQKLNPYEREILDKEVQQFQNDIKDEKRIISEIGAISDSSLNEAKKNPNAAKTIGAQIAKVMQGSRLTDADVKLYTGQEGVVNIIQDYVTEALSGTISDDKAKNIKSTLDVYNKALRISLNNRANQAAAITSQNFDPNLNLNPRDMAPLFYISDTDIKSTSKDVPAGMVRMKSPDGRVLDIPKENIEKAKKRGLIEVK